MEFLIHVNLRFDWLIRSMTRLLHYLSISYLIQNSTGWGYHQHRCYCLSQCRLFSYSLKISCFLEKMSDFFSYSDDETVVIAGTGLPWWYLSNILLRRCWWWGQKIGAGIFFEKHFSRDNLFILSIWFIFSWITLWLLPVFDVLAINIYVYVGN